jgi:protein-tyrosine phosphatase
MIVAVCTGNVCRSPMVERLLRARLAGVADLTVTSAGTAALVGEPIDGPIAGLLQQAGGDPTCFAARQLTAADLQQADLVVALAREHRSAVVTLEPAAVRRTFLLEELVVLAGAVAATGWPVDVRADPAARLAALPRLAPGHRAAVLARPAVGVPDPYRRPPAVYAEVSQRLVTDVEELVRAVR